MSQRIRGFLKNDLWSFLLDVVSVNLAYWLALILRFFVNGEFRVSVGY